jgi:hypothetical protein
MTFQHSLIAHFLPSIPARRVDFALPNRQGKKNANKSCHTTATSPLVGGVLRDFMRHLPFQRWHSLVAVYAL